MPIYEYRCQDCRRKVSVFFRSVSVTAEPRCPRCNGTNLDRLFSRVFVRRGGGHSAEDPTDGEEFGQFEGADSFADESFDDLGLDGPDFSEDTDPREMARWTRQMSAQMGEPLDPDLDQALTDIERGADPEEVLDRLEESEPVPSPQWDDDL